jgi:hypothetical protein
MAFLLIFFLFGGKYSLISLVILKHVFLTDQRRIGTTLLFSIEKISKVPIIPRQRYATAIVNPPNHSSLCATRAPIATPPNPPS